MTRLAWLGVWGALGAGGVAVLGGCGLVLDARAADDAAAGGDARGMDASAPPVDSGSDAGTNLLDDAEPIDTSFPIDDSVPPLDAASEDAFERLDDAFTIPDGNVRYPDASLTPIPDASTDARAMLDVAASVPRDAGRDARGCLSEAECAPITVPAATGNLCESTMCSAGTCVGTGDSPIHCPPAGDCARPCVRGSDGPVCVREGTACSEVFGACDVAAMCPARTTCVSMPGCPAGVCLPSCSTGASCTITLRDGRTFPGTCSGSVCRPTGVMPDWCATP